MKHSKYLDKLRDNKFKHLNMNHRDRDSFLKYISDTNTTCTNVKRRTRRQLNPDQCKFNQLIFFQYVVFLFLFLECRGLYWQGKIKPRSIASNVQKSFPRRQILDNIHRLFGEIKREKDEKLTGWLKGNWTPGPVQNAKRYTALQVLMYIKQSEFLTSNQDL